MNELKQSEQQELQDRRQHSDWLDNLHVFYCNGNKCRFSSYNIICLSCCTVSVTFDAWKECHKNSSKVDPTKEMEPCHCGRKFNDENSELCNDELNTETFQHCVDCYGTSEMDAFNSHCLFDGLK